MNKKIFITAASISVMALGAFAFANNGNSQLFSLQSAENPFTLTVTAGDVTTLSESLSTVSTKQGSKIPFGHTNISIADGKIVLTDGTLFNHDDATINPDGGALSGITSITINLADDVAGQALDLTYAWVDKDFKAETFTVQDNIAIDLSEINPNYFHLDGTATIESITATYTCVRGEEVIDNTMRVYVKTYDTWTGVNIWAWGGTGVGNLFTEWPGEPMNYDEELGLYYYDYDTTVYTNVLFTRDTDENTKTPDLLSPTDENADCYVWDKGWYNEDTEVVPVINDRTIYLADPNKFWNNTGAEFRAWVWGGTGGDKWIYFTDENADGVFEATLHVSYTDIIFLRSEPGKTGWDGEWGRIQTKLDATKSTFTLSSYDAGSWSN